MFSRHSTPLIRLTSCYPSFIRCCARRGVGIHARLPATVQGPDADNSWLPNEGLSVIMPCR